MARVSGWEGKWLRIATWSQQTSATSSVSHLMRNIREPVKPLCSSVSSLFCLHSEFDCHLCKVIARAGDKVANTAYYVLLEFSVGSVLPSLLPLVSLPKSGKAVWTKNVNHVKFFCFVS